MNSTDSHIIHKLTVEVTTPSIREGYALRNNVRAFVDKYVVPAVEKYISELESEIGPQEYLQIDRLDITVNAQSPDLEAHGFSSAISNEIATVFRRKKLDIPALETTNTTSVSAAATAQRSQAPGGLKEDENTASGMRRVSPAIHGIGTVFYFLEHGTRPWWSTDPAAFSALLEEKELLGFAANEPAFRQQFWQKTQLSHVRRRLVRQFSDGFLAQLLLVLNVPGSSVETGGLPQVVKAVLEVFFAAVSAGEREQLWHLVLQELRLVSNGHTNTGLALAIALKQRLAQTGGVTGTAGTAQQSLTPGATADGTVAAEQTSRETTGSPVVGSISDTGITGRKGGRESKVSVELKKLELQVMNGLQIVHLLSGRNETPAYYQKLLQHKELFGDPVGSEGGASSSGRQTKTADAKKSSLPETGTEPETGAPHNEQVSAAGKNANAEAVENGQPATEKPVTEDRTSGEPVTSVINDTRGGSPESTEKNELQRDSFQEEPEHLIVDNAGLVLLHPYIRRFFDTVGLTDGKKLTDPVLAAHALHYLATGNECAYEHAMQFEKYLTGIPFTESIERQVPLSEALKNEAHELLESVKANWKPMNGSSAGAIRETFLQRSGKLFNEAQPRLIVERKTVDILLDQLPWGTSIVKLPWMEHLLFVEW